MCKAHRLVTHIKQQNIYFITSKAVNIIRSSYYIHGPWGDEIYFCCLICVTQLWALHVAEILALPLFEYKRPQYWNSTSGFNCDLFTVIGIWLCIGLPDFMQIGWSPTDLWHHIDFKKWQPERRKKSTSGFWFGHVSHLRSSKDIGILNFDQIISLHGRDITTFSSSKQTATILKCYFRFQLDLFSVIGMRFCISLPNFVQKGWSRTDSWRHIDFPRWRSERRKSSATELWLWRRIDFPRWRT